MSLNNHDGSVVAIPPHAAKHRLWRIARRLARWGLFATGIFALALLAWHGFLTWRVRELEGWFRANGYPISSSELRASRPPLIGENGMGYIYRAVATSKDLPESDYDLVPQFGSLGIPSDGCSYTPEQVEATLRFLESNASFRHAMQMAANCKETYFSYRTSMDVGCLVVGKTYLNMESILFRYAVGTKDWDSARYELECMKRMVICYRDAPYLVGSLIHIALRGVFERNLVKACTGTEVPREFLHEILMAHREVMAMSKSATRTACEEASFVRELSLDAFPWDVNEYDFIEDQSRSPWHKHFRVMRYILASGPAAQSVASLSVVKYLIETEQTPIEQRDIKAIIEKDKREVFGSGAALVPDQYYEDALAGIVSVLRTEQARYASMSSAHCVQAYIGTLLYRARHGRLPENLAALVPDILPDIPIDIYDKKPLRYAAAEDGNSFRVWSVGLDGIDDGGASLRKSSGFSSEAEAQNPPIVHYGVSHDTKDIVLTWTRPSSQPAQRAQHKE